MFKVRYIFKHIGLIWDFIKSPRYKQTYKNQYEGKCYVLVNGPSLKDALHKYDIGDLPISSDSIMVNMGALDEHFLRIKPKHMCFADAMFYRDYGPKKKDVKKTFSIINERVDWDMNIYMCYNTSAECDKFMEYSQIKNPHIHFMRMNRLPCDNWDSKYWNKLLSSGYFMPTVGSVGNVALHVALLCGYKEIELYGVDHNQFLEFCVNDDNQLCSLDSHFYENDSKPKMKPVVSTWNAKERQRRISEYMVTLLMMFRGHEMHAQWAKYLGARILNCTPNSMIDSFDRIGRDGKIHKCPYY